MLLSERNKKGLDIEGIQYKVSFNYTVIFLIYAIAIYTFAHTEMFA